VKWVLLVAVLIQLIPFGHSHTNPPKSGEPAWDSPGTRELFHRACFDCHSNETRWPWYAHVAPTSWLLQRDVNEGRRHLNFSEWDRPQHHRSHVAEQVKEGEMPPWYYLPMHPQAKLSETEKRALIAGAEKTLGQQHGPGNHGHEEEEEEHSH